MTHGRWVFVCGPSGAGKDSVIGWARDALARQSAVVFTRRLVTRDAGAGAQDEAISPSAFARRAAGGGFAWHWQAHGLHYGIDAAWCRDVGAGRTVVVNGSREHAAGLAGAPGVRLVLVTAPPALLQERLHGRGREAPEAVVHRLARGAALPPLSADLVIDNSGQLEAAGRQLAAFLQEHA